MKADLDAKELANEVAIDVSIKHYRQFILRNWIAAQLIRLAAFVSWAEVRTISVPTEPYLYYCPKCYRETADFKPIEDRVIHCSHCHYQFISVNVGDSIHVLAPDYDNDYDEYGCHWDATYGFVPMAGCPRHD